MQGVEILYDYNWLSCNRSQMFNTYNQSLLANFILSLYSCLPFSQPIP